MKYMPMNFYVDILMGSGDKASKMIMIRASYMGFKFLKTINMIRQNEKDFIPFHSPHPFNFQIYTGLVEPQILMIPQISFLPSLYNFKLVDFSRPLSLSLSLSLFLSLSLSFFLSLFPFRKFQN